jgi:hypothetical protein
MATRKTRKTSPQKAVARKAAAKAAPKKAAPKKPAPKKSTPRKSAPRRPAARYPHAETVICTYRVKEGREGEMLELIGRHWPTLRRMKLATPERPVVFQGEDDSGKTFFVEVFSWVDSEAAGRAHHMPAVMAVWGPMGDLVEERLGRPGMEFPHVKPAFVQFKKV